MEIIVFEAFNCCWLKGGKCNDNLNYAENVYSLAQEMLLDLFWWGMFTPVAIHGYSYLFIFCPVSFNNCLFLVSRVIETYYLVTLCLLRS